MVEKGLAVLAALAGPLIGVLLRSSRRTRLRHRVDEYLALAERLGSHDAETADRLRALAREAVNDLIRRDTKWLHQRFDPAALAAIVFFVGPAIAIFVWALSWDSAALRWPVLVVTCIWTLVWGAVGLTQLRKEQE